MSEASSETESVPVPPGFLELTGAFGAARILLHHSQIGEVEERRGAHGTPRPTMVRHRTQRRKWEVEQSAAEIRRTLAAAILVDRPNAMTLVDILLQVGFKRLHSQKLVEGRSC